MSARRRGNGETSRGARAQAAAETAGGHAPVLLSEVQDALQPHPGGRYLDATFGGGGHTAALLAASAPDGTVLALDRDPAALERAAPMVAASGGRLRLLHADFGDLAALAVHELPFQGILFDLGVSSLQLDDAERGFSFLHEGPLDMRMDPTHGQPASSLVNELPEAELADLIYQHGEERLSRRIARAIVRRRAVAPLLTTTDLAAVVAGVVPRTSGSHPATRTFQALRIAVNDELGALARGLTSAVDLLATGGRLVVISFQSLEDRIVKHRLREEATDCVCPPALPVCRCGHRARLRLVGRQPVTATDDEVAANPRARSAKMRVAERLATPAVTSTEVG